MGLISGRARDIKFNNDRALVVTLAYLTKKGVVGMLEAEVPDDKVSLFKKEFPGKKYCKISQGTTSSGKKMKYGVQFRIYLIDKSNCPSPLRNNLATGRGKYVARVNRSKFVELLIRDYGFDFGEGVNKTKVRNCVRFKHVKYLYLFDKLCK